MSSPRFPIPQGTLDMLILQIVALEAMHGYGIAPRLEQISPSVVQVNQGSLYPALHRLEQKGLLRGLTGKNRRRAGKPSSTRSRLPGESSLPLKKTVGRA